MVKTEDSLSPPYIGYPSWKRLLENFREGMPARIDTSYLSSLKISGSTQSMFKGALLFLGLADKNGMPQEKLRELVQAEGAQHLELLKGITQKSYRHLLSQLDLSQATPGQLKEYFKNRGESGDKGRKCASFFLSLAGDAGLPIARHLKTAGSRRRSKKVAPEKPYQLPLAPAPAAPTTNGFSWGEHLMAKFPEFNPAWSEPIMEKWFAGWQKLIEITSAVSREGQGTSGSAAWPSTNSKGLT